MVGTAKLKKILKTKKMATTYDVMYIIKFIFYIIAVLSTFFQIS
jgi:hypothetical protein